MAPVLIIPQLRERLEAQSTSLWQPNKRPYFCFFVRDADDSGQTAPENDNARTTEGGPHLAWMDSRPQHRKER